MEHEEIVRAQFAAAERRATWPRAMELYDESVVLLAGGGMPNSGLHVGLRAAGQWFADWLSAFDDPVRFDLAELVPGRDGLALHARHTARGRESGAELTLDVFYAYWFRDGRVIRAEVHTNRADAWRAAGVIG